MKNINQEAAVIAQIQNLVKEIQKCAPHPDRLEDKGPQLLHKDVNHQLPAEYDATLGAMMTETLLSATFSAAVSEMGMEWMSTDNAAEAASTVYQDRMQPAAKIGARYVIANDFNRAGSAFENAQYLERMAAYMADLPARKYLEKWLAHETRRLYALRKQARMAMPMPSFAA